MFLTLKLTPELAERFREGVAHQDVSLVKEVLVLAIDENVQSLMLDYILPPPMTEQEWDEAVAELDAIMDEGIDPNARVLLNNTWDREEIYGDHS